MTSRHFAVREGFVLLTVLWALTGIVALVLLVSLTSHEAIDIAQNRVSATRVAWRAEGCLERARSAIDEALRGANGDAAWRDLDVEVAESPLVRGCAVTVAPTGTTVDANTASGEQLVLLFLAAGVPPDRADSLAAAVLDWRDADSIALPGGAEVEWYAGQMRPAPRNGAFVAVEELRLVRGADAIGKLDTLLGVESGRLLLSRAPAAALATLPGFGSEAVARTLELRGQGRTVTLEMLTGTLSPNARTQLTSHYTELATLVATTPDAWLLSSRAAEGAPEVAVRIELRLVRAGERAAVLSRRSVPWS